MPHLLYEAHMPGKAWKMLLPRTLSPYEPPGSCVDTTLGRGDVIFFGCTGNSSIIARAIGTGAPLITFSSRQRAVIISGELEPLSQLYDGESFEMDMRSPAGTAYRARWTHHD